MDTGKFLQPGNREVNFYSEREVKHRVHQNAAINWSEVCLRVLERLVRLNARNMVKSCFLTSLLLFLPWQAVQSHSWEQMLDRESPRLATLRAQSPVEVPREMHQAIRAKIADALERDGSVEVWIRLDVDFTPEGFVSHVHKEAFSRNQRKAVISSESALLDSLGSSVISYKSFEGFIPWVLLETTADGMESLKRYSRYDSILLPEIYSPHLSSTASLVGSRAHSPGSLLNSYGPQEYGFVGSGYTVAVLDTGIRHSHQAFSQTSKLRHEACFSSNRSVYPTQQSLCQNGQDLQIGAGAAPEGPDTTCDENVYGCGHGTHVSSIAAGLISSSGYGYDGLAQGAQVMPINVAHKRNACGDQPSPCVRISDSDLANGLSHAYSYRGGSSPLVAINLSLGRGPLFSSGYTGFCSGVDSPIEDAIAQLVSVGVAVIASTGNEGLDDRTKFPACLASTIAVGGTWPDTDSVWRYSGGGTNVSEALDLYAPAPVYAADAFEAYTDTPPFVIPKIGTSMAAPHVSGAIAQLKQIIPDASPFALMALLQETGVPVVFAGTERARIDLRWAMKSLVSAPTSIEVSGNAGQHTANVDAITSSVNWSSISSTPWIILNNASGSGSGALEFSVLENQTGSTRFGEIFVLGNLVEITQLTTAPTRIIRLEGDLSFGEVQVGSTAIRTLTIHNDGNNTLTVDSIWVPSDFSINWNQGSIGAGGSQEVQVTYAPDVIGSISADLSVDSNATSGNNEHPISGSGVEGPTRIIRLTGNLNFGDVQVNSTATRTLRIHNDGNSTLQVTSISYPSGFSGNWNGGNIGAGNFRDVQVTFAPPSAGTYDGDVEVSSNATNNDNTRAISGTGVVAPTRIIRLDGNLSFGDVQVGSAATRTLTIYNDGNSTLQVTDIAYPFGFSGDWNGGNIGAGNSRDVQVTFEPPSAGTYGGDVEVSSNAAGDNTHAISGTGVDEPTYTLSLTKSGSGTGTITSSPPGINCDQSCDSDSASFPMGTPVTLHVQQSSGSAFGGWSVESCIGMVSCQITMTENQSVTAFFYHPIEGDLLFDNGMPEENSIGYPSFSERQTSNQLLIWEAADDFILPQHSQVTGVRVCGSWWGDLSCDAEFSSLRVLFFEDNEGRPADNYFYEEFVLPGCFIQGPDAFSSAKVCYEAEIPALNIASNQKFWTVIQPHQPVEHFYVHSSGSGAEVNGLEAHFRNVTQGGDWTGFSEQFSGNEEVDISFFLFGDSVQEPEPAWVTAFKDGTGDGVVTSSPAGLWGGIDCGQTCSDEYMPGTEVTLQAQPAGNSEFAFWTSSTGICSGPDPECTFVVGDGPVYTAVAMFSELQEPPLFHDNFEGDGASGSVRGIRFSGSVTGISGNGDWASDMRLDLSSPDSRNFSVGGIGAGAAETDWDFQGSVSNNDGEYTSQHLNAYPTGAQLDGSWTADLTHTWASGTTMSWNEVSIALLNSNGSELGWLCIDSFDIAPGSPQTFQLQASECEFGSEDEIINVTFSPASPATVEPGDHILATIDYRIANPDGAYIWAYGLVNGQIMGLYQPSPVVPAGVGQLTRYFSRNSTGEFLEVGVRMSNPDPQEILDKKTYNVEYVFEKNTDGDNVVSDGSFEGGSPSAHWYEYSTNFDSPICSVSTCPTWFGPFSGTGWAWFGGHGAAIETGILSQDVVIPSGVSAQLQFQLAIPTTNGSGFLRVSLGEQEVFFVDESDGEAFSTYQLVTVNMDAFANGNPQTLKFESVTQADGTVNFFLDDVRLLTYQ